MVKRPNTRTLLIQNWYFYRSLLLTSRNQEEYYIRSGALYAISRILETLGTTDDGPHPIPPDKWLTEAAKIAQTVANSLSVPRP